MALLGCACARFRRSRCGSLARLSACTTCPAGLSSDFQHIENREPGVAIVYSVGARSPTVERLSSSVLRILQDLDPLVYSDPSYNHRAKRACRNARPCRLENSNAVNSELNNRIQTTPPRSQARTLRVCGCQGKVRTGHIDAECRTYRSSRAPDRAPSGCPQTSRWSDPGSWPTGPRT